MHKVLARTVLGLLLVVLAGACVPHRPYWVEKPKDGKRWARSSESFKPILPEVKLEEPLPAGACPPQLRVVEFDDNGDTWAPKQTTAMQDMILGRGVPDPWRKPLVVVYIHGWKNNAAPENGDFKTFQKLLTRLAAQSSPGKALERHRVCGIYIGWRGDTLDPAWIWPTLGMACIARQLTIYPRMYAADRVSNGLPLTGLLGDITQQTYAQKGKCVMVGHSLGGRILETAMSRTLVDAPHQKPDLVLLVNPASDAQRAYQTMQSVEWDHRAKLGDYYVPAIISMRSDSDSATGKIYPFAMTLGKVFRSKRHYPVEIEAPPPGQVPTMQPRKLDVSQRYYVTYPAARIDYLRSHRVYPQNVAPESLPKADAVLQYNLSKGRREGFVISSDRGLKWWQITRDLDGSYKMYRPEKKVGAYWIMALDPQVLNGHSGQPTANGIFSDGMIELFGALYTICQPASSSGSAPDRVREVPARVLDRQIKLHLTPQILPPTEDSENPGSQPPAPAPAAPPRNP